MKHAVTTLLAALLCASTLQAQSREIELGVGLALPSGALGEEHTLGPLLRGALVFVHANPAWRLRVEGMTASMPARRSGPDSADASNPVDAISAMTDLMVGVPTGKLQPFVLLGIGLQRFTRAGGAATATAIRAGAGLRLKLEAVSVVLELTPTFALIRSGAISDAWGVQYAPLTAGITF